MKLDAISVGIGLSYRQLERGVLTVFRKQDTSFDLYDFPDSTFLLCLSCSAHTYRTVNPT